jgi:hypothetical protein
MSSTALTAVSAAGAIIRYSFYLAGLFVFGAIALGIGWVMQNRPTLVDTPAAFRITGSEVRGLTRTSEVSTMRGTRFEAANYGQLYHHDRDMTVIMVMPPDGTAMARDFASELATIPLLRTSRARLQPTFYDLETRFGPLRAAEMYVDADGRRKLCLAFLSRFETPYVYLKGWLCEADGARPSAGALACLINGLTLDQPLANRDADAFLRARSTRGGYCQATPVSQTTDTRRPRSTPRRYY